MGQYPRPSSAREAANKQACPRCATRQAVSSRTPGLGCSPGGADPTAGGLGGNSSDMLLDTSRCLVQPHVGRFAPGRARGAPVRPWCQPVTTNGPGCQPVTAGRLETSRLQHRPATNPRQPSGLATRSLAKWSSICVSLMGRDETTTKPGRLHIVRAFPAVEQSQFRGGRTAICDTVS